jgi:hypothetical protein
MRYGWLTSIDPASVTAAIRWVLEDWLRAAKTK